MKPVSRYPYIPQILIPSLFIIKNFILRECRKPNTLLRLLIGILIGMGLMLSIYKGGFVFLSILDTQRNFIYADPKLILNILFSSLFILLLFTNLFQSLTQIYASKDLDLIHKSPISVHSFFLGNALKTYFLTTWMSIIFVIPVVAFLAKSYHDAPLLYYLSITFPCLLFFTLPTSLGYIIASIYPIILPGKYAKVIVRIVILGLIILLIRSLLLISSQVSQYISLSFDDLTRVLPFLNFINNPLLPNFWISSILGNQLLKDQNITSTYVLALGSLSVLLASTAYLSLRTFYYLSLTLHNSASGARLSPSKIREKRLRIMFRSIDSAYRGFVIKDFRIFSRNISQAGQMLMLLFMVATYLYIINFQVGYISQLDAIDRTWWINALTISNSCLEAFIALAIGTRIIYPQWSYEGRCIWILKSSPLSLKNIFNAKFSCWYIPTSIFLSILFTLSLYALKAPIEMLALKFAFTMITTHTLISLGLGLSAYFSDFSKENPAEVTASIGSLIFMLVGFVVIFINLGFQAAIFSSGQNKLLAFDTTKEFNITNFTLSLALIMLSLNLIISKFSLYLGQNHLKKTN